MGATGYFTHPNCWKHEMGTGHPECPERLGAIEDRLLISGVDMALQRREASPASLADIELAHGRMHVASLRGLSDVLKEEIEAGGPTHSQVEAVQSFINRRLAPRRFRLVVQRTAIEVVGPEPSPGPDTPAQPGS